MSQIIKTEVGNFRIVTDGQTKWPLWECLHCGEKHQLQEAQMGGEMPVICLGYPPTETPHYFEIHGFGRHLHAALLSAMLFNVNPFEAEQ